MALSLVFSGGINNYCDRLVNNGTVVGFLNIGAGSIRTGVFNIADVVIFVGIFVCLLVEQNKKIIS